MKKLFSLFVLSLWMISLLSCTKEGPAGPKGEDGNANVKTYKYTIKTDEWQGSGGNYYHEESIPEITEDIYENGDVRVYIKSNNSEQYQALPYTWISNPNYQYIAKYWYGVGSLKIQVVFNDPNNTVTWDFEVKVVIIEGNAVNKNVDYNNYESVKIYYGLKD